VVEVSGGLLLSVLFGGVLGLVWSGQPDWVRSEVQSFLLLLVLPPELLPLLVVPDVLEPLSGYAPASARRLLPDELVPLELVLSLECMSEQALRAAKPKAAARATHSRVFMSVPRHWWC
jgi:hypothetical protein